MKYLIDAWAWIEYLIGSKAGEKVKEIVENETNEVFTCSITLAEIISKVKREEGDEKAENCYNIIVSLSKIKPVDSELAKSSGLKHSEIKTKMSDFGLADAFVLVTAESLKAKIVTGDKHFKDFGNVVFLD